MAHALRAGLLALPIMLSACAAPRVAQMEAAAPAPVQRDVEIVTVVAAEPLAAPGGFAALPDFTPIAKKVARSTWGILPDAPERKVDATADLVRGTAVAVEDGVLLASCSAVEQLDRVGLVRLSKYYVANVVATDALADVCVLAAPDAPLNLGLGYRDPMTLERGEPVLAIVTTGSRERLELAGRAADPVFAFRNRVLTTIELPADTLSAIFVDSQGRLLGIGPSRLHQGPGTAIIALPRLLLGDVEPTYALLD